MILAVLAISMIFAAVPAVASDFESAEAYCRDYVRDMKRCFEFAGNSGILPGAAVGETNRRALPPRMAGCI